MEWVNALMASVKDFRDLVFRPLTLFAFGLLALLLLTLPKAYLGWLGLSVLNEQHRGKISITMLVLLVVGIIRTLDVYFFPWRRQRKQQERDRESLRGRLETLSIYELSILAYCLSRNRRTFFVLDQGHNTFEDAVRSLTTRGFFKQGPLAIQGYSFDITDDYWQLLQHFKEEIRTKAETVYPDLNQKFEFYDNYQKTYGFGQSESQPAQFNYTSYREDVFNGVIWRWRYRFEFGPNPLDLTPYCPDCEDDEDAQELVSNLRRRWVIHTGDNGYHRKVVGCPVHNKKYEIPSDENGNYVTIAARILNNIETGKWKEIIEQQRK